MNEFNTKFQINKLLITQIGNWIISLRPQQITIGSLVLSLNRSCANFGGLTKEEGKDLIIAFSVIESLLGKTFNPDRINYLALMMVDFQVHYHVIPRYKESIFFKEVKYDDKDWPKPPNILESLELDED